MPKAFRVFFVLPRDDSRHQSPCSIHSGKYGCRIYPKLALISGKSKQSTRTCRIQQLRKKQYLTTVVCPPKTKADESEPVGFERHPGNHPRGSIRLNEYHKPLLILHITRQGVRAQRCHLLHLHAVKDLKQLSIGSRVYSLDSTSSVQGLLSSNLTLCCV